MSDTSQPNSAAEDAAAAEQADRDWEIYDAEHKVKQLHAYFSDRIFVQPNGRFLRISFGERVGDETIYHSAISVPVEEAMEFGSLLARMAHANWEAMLRYYRNVVAESDVVSALSQNEGEPDGG